ncbi:hypothetical protein IQ241_08025 [Romeria aff. gracilis LEGE 07310]|uniref:Uncharacterized protein n=1 Tax=Vasconcelosia minhoensis LEGE 07310 TaxID=915328 RepID=A0A8J7DLK4_9CYAN|nr:hypothetical protein [Romeria gracilis]MBE9077241.1 hypothetical protein [Romeria aff. gracilis LEGE 07310]
MASSASDTARFRSATEFPKSIQGLGHEQANTLYAEMRDCLVFTNRSRAQLIRRNTEHKDTTLQLRERIRHFQGLIDQLQNQKLAQLQEKELLIAQLASEMAEMGAQLDVLSDAFDAVGDPEAMVQTHWGYVAFPGRFLQLVKAVKAVILWWKRKDEDGELLRGDPQPALPSDNEEDRRDRPQLYTDQASINRSLLDP